MNTLYMSMKRLTQSQYVHQKVVETLGNLVTYYNERGLSLFSRILLYSAVIERVVFDIHRDINTGLLPYKEFSEERLCTDKAKW